MDNTTNSNLVNEDIDITIEQDTGIEKLKSDSNNTINNILSDDKILKELMREFKIYLNVKELNNIRDYKNNKEQLKNNQYIKDAIHALESLAIKDDYEGYKKVSKYLNIDINAFEEVLNSQPILFRMYQQGRIEVAKVLIEKYGANINHDEYPPLGRVDHLEDNKLETYKYLFEKGANPNTNSSSGILLTLIKDKEIRSLFMEYGGNPEYKYIEKKRVFMGAR